MDWSCAPFMSPAQPGGRGCPSALRPAQAPGGLTFTCTLGGSPGHGSMSKRAAIHGKGTSWPVRCRAGPNHAPAAGLVPVPNVGRLPPSGQRLRRHTARARADDVHIQLATDRFSGSPAPNAARRDHENHHHVLGPSPAFFVARAITKITRIVADNDSCHQPAAITGNRPRRSAPADQAVHAPAPPQIERQNPHPRRKTVPKPLRGRTVPPTRAAPRRHQSAPASAPNSHQSPRSGQKGA